MSSEGASLPPLASQISSHISSPASSSQPLDVPIFLPQDGHLVPEQHRVQPHLGVHQGHEAQPLTEGIHAGLPLSEVVGVGPPRRPGALLVWRQ